MTAFPASPSQCSFRPLSCQSASAAPQARQTACPTRAWVLAFSRAGSCDEDLVGQSPFDAGEQVVHARRDRHVAPIEAPSHFVEIFAKVFGRYPMMNAEDLPLQERPNAFHRVGMDIA